MTVSRADYIDRDPPTALHAADKPFYAG
jgi:hypothetical protein